MDSVLALSVSHTLDSLFPFLSPAATSSPGAGEVCQRESLWRNRKLCMDCQSLSLWERWHRASDDGEGEAAVV